MWSMCLACFTKHNVFKIPPCCSEYQYFLSLYGGKIFPCRNLFIHLSVDGQVGCLYLWAIVTNPPMAIHVIHVPSFHVDICFQFSWVDAEE